VIGRRRVAVLVDVYTRERCGLCVEAERIVTTEARGATIRRIDIDADPELQLRYNLRVPVVVVDGTEVAEGRVVPGVVRAALRAVRRRAPSRVA